MFDKLYGLSKLRKISFHLQNCGSFNRIMHDYILCGSSNRIVVCCKAVKTGIVSNVYGIAKTSAYLYKIRTVFIRENIRQYNKRLKIAI